MALRAGQLTREALSSTGKIMAGQVTREVLSSTGKIMVGQFVRETLRSSEFTAPTCSDLLAATSSGVVVDGVATDAWIDDFDNGAQSSAP